MVQKNNPSSESSVPGTVEIGYVSGVFGTRGEVKVYLYNPDSTLFNGPLNCGLVGVEGTMVSVAMSVRSGAGKKIIGRFNVCTSRDQAESIVGHKIVVHRTALPELEPDEFYISDLEQMRVMSFSGDAVGTVSDVHATARGDMLEIHEGQNVYFVPLSDPFVLDIDIDSKTLVLSETGMQCL